MVRRDDFSEEAGVRGEFDERQSRGGEESPSAEVGGRIVGGAFGLAFLGIGLTVIGFLWSQPFGEFGSPPLVFRLFGSCIAFVFVVVGGLATFGAISGKLPGRSAGRARGGASGSRRDIRSGDRYECSRCGAPLDGNADVSPHGDVKCSHCDTWFNIHDA